MNKLVIPLLVVLLVVPAASQSFGSDQLQKFKEAYNSQTSKIPDFLGTIIGGEKINFILESNSTNETLGVAFDGLKISNITQDKLDSPTLKVWTDQETVSTILNSTEKYSTIQEKLDKNEIQYRTTRIETGIKMTVLTALQDLASFLGLSF